MRMEVQSLSNFVYSSFSSRHVVYIYFYNKTNLQEDIVVCIRESGRVASIFDFFLIICITPFSMFILFHISFHPCQSTSSLYRINLFLLTVHVPAPDVTMLSIILVWIFMFYFSL